MSSTPSSHYRPLWRRLALWMVAFSLIPALAIALVLLNRNAEMIKITSREVRLTATEAVSVPLDLLAADGLQQLVAVGQALGDPALQPEIKMGLVRTLVSSSSVIDHAMIYDAGGQHIDTIKKQDLAFEPNTEALNDGAREATAAKGSLVGDVLRDDRVLMMVPLKTPDDKTTGYVVSYVEMNQVQDVLRTMVDEKFEQKADSLVVLNQSGEVVLSVAEKAPELDPKLLTRAKELSKVPGVATSEELAESSQDTLATFKPLNHAPWIVVARVPRAVAYAPLESLRFWVIIALLCVVILGVAFSILFARGITRPINALMTQCRALARREFQTRVSIDSKDELGVLAQTLNTSAEQLADSEQELLRQERIRTDLGRYLPQELVERVVVHEDDVIDLTGTSQQVTVMFADVVAFTELCNHLTPEQTVNVLNELFTILTEIIFRHGGVVDKFIGDSVMAFWGAPEPNEDHAVDACSAAEEMVSWLELGNVAWQEKYGIEIELAVGIHSGEAVVGNVGSDTRLAYTAIGDTVNLAARLESIARPNQILVTRATANLVDDLFSVSYAGERSMQGHEEPLELFEVTL